MLLVSLHLMDKCKHYHTHTNYDNYMALYDCMLLNHTERASLNIAARLSVDLGCRQELLISISYNVRNLKMVTYYEG